MADFIPVNEPLLDGNEKKYLKTKENGMALLGRLVHIY